MIPIMMMPAYSLGMQKSVAYFVLDQLVQKGFASAVVVNKRREYRPLEPDMLKGMLEERKKAFMKNLENLQGIVLAARKRKAPLLFNIFSGWDGMKLAFSDVIKTMKGREGEYYVFSVDVPEKVFPRFRRFIKSFHHKRAEEGIMCRLPVSSRLRSTIGKDRKAEPNTAVRFVASEYTMPMAVNVYSDKALLAIWTDPPLSIVIQSKDVADSFRSFFWLLWKTGGE